MKTFRNWLLTLIISLIISLSFSSFGITGNAKVDNTPNNDEASISTHQALQDFKLYLQKQIAKHNLTLSPEQIDSLMAKSRSLIYENSQEGQVTQANSRKIQKDFKLYLKTTYPENFKIKRSKNEVNYKLARRRIRATTKDFIINKLQIKNGTDVKEYWNKVKDLVYKKLDKAAYFNDFNELVVDESAIAEIIGKVFNTLEMNNPNDHNGSVKNTNNPNRKRKAIVPEKLSAPIAEKLVRQMVRNKGISTKNIETLTLKIMKIINKNLKRGRIEKEFVIKTTKQEIENFLYLKSNVVRKGAKRYLDRFIDAMGKVP
jgi:hypothetical protein